MRRLAVCLITLLIVSGCATAPAPETTPAPVTKAVPEPAALASKAPAKAPEEKETGKTIKHAAIGAKVQVSSTHTEWPGEGPADNLVDGKLATRWSSDWSEPQQVTIDLGKPEILKGLRLYWETAAAKKYTVSVSPDGKDWVSVGEKATDALGPRTDEFTLKDQAVQSIRIDLLNRVVATNWGFSLYEVEAVTD